MAHSQATKDDLRRRYIVDGLSLAMSAVMTEVSYPTAQRWKNVAKDTGDDWDKVRVAHTLAGGNMEDTGRQILTDFLVQFKLTMDVLKQDDLSATTRVGLLASLADGYSKTVNTSKKLLPETSKLAVAIEVLEKLAIYLKDKKPELLADFMDVLEPFGEQLERELK